MGPKPEVAWVPAHGQGPHCSQCSLGEGGRAPGPLWYQGFYWRFPMFRYKSKPSEEPQPHPVLLFSGKGGVYLCPRSVLQPCPSSVAWAKDRGVQGETGSTRCGGRGVAEVPACSERKRGAGAASLWSALPFISLAGPTPSFANSVQCSLKCSLQRVLIPFGCILKSNWKRLSLLETDPSLIAKCGWVVSVP